MFEKKLHKSENDKMICGVCGGIAAYFQIDATVVRLIWAIITAFAGAGLVAYIAAAVIMPKAEDDDIIDM